MENNDKRKQNVIEILEDSLSRAKEGKINYVVVVCEEGGATRVEASESNLVKLTMASSYVASVAAQKSVVE